jgi:hypothetical protein
VKLSSPTGPDVSVHIADAGPTEVTIWPDPGDIPADRFRRADHGDLDSLLHAYGWHRVGPWTTADDVPPGHKLAMVRRTDTVLTRDQQLGRERRATQGGDR